MPAMEKRTFRPARSAALALVLVGLLAGLHGCSRKKMEDAYLLRVKGFTLTVAEFNQALEAAAGEVFAGRLKGDSRALEDLRLRILNQLSEEMIIRAFAAEQQIQVTAEELDKAVEAIKADYPDNTFEETLLENAVSYDFWRSQLSVRLLIEKVVAKELLPTVQVSTDEVGEYQKSVYPKGPPEGEGLEGLNQRIASLLRRQKAEEAFKAWIEGLRVSYPVEINRQAWKYLTEEGHRS